MDPALQLFQLSQHSPAWMDGLGGGIFSLAFEKRLSHDNIVVDHENISNTFPSVM